jgi:hypothetical protein
MTALCGLAAEVTIGALTIGAFWILLPAASASASRGRLHAARQLADRRLLCAEQPLDGARLLRHGVTLGGNAGQPDRRPVTDAFGWRTAFFVLWACRGSSSRSSCG